MPNPFDQFDIDDRARTVFDQFNAGELNDNQISAFNELKERGAFDQFDQPGPVVPSESISTITGKPVTEQELMRGGLDIKPSETEPFVRPIVEAGGMAAGGLAAAPGVFTTPAGGALGYAAAKQLVDILYGKERPETATEAVQKTAKDIATGATMELGGQVVGKAVQLAAKPIGEATKQILGATTGAGPGMIETALSGKPGFKAAMRGKITGNEIVDNTMDALQTLRDKRISEYQKNLSRITDEKIDITPIKDKLSKLMKRYNIKTTPEGELDFSRIAMGKKGRDDIEDVVEILSDWGTKEGDTTALGLDVLKRQLDDFYSPSSQARGFVQSLKSDIRKTISREIPAYKEMTQGYSEATSLIKDMEAGLMLRKQGMTGRITADQTLRRLTSALRENFELRKDLLTVLGDRSGEDLLSQVGGYSASELIPRGLFGKQLAAGTVGVAAFVNPKFWPVLAASSPRVVGEFLSVYGKGMKEIQKKSPALYKTLGYALGKQTEER
jgi:hypothetical protein